SLNNLAVLYMEMGVYPNAVFSLYQQSLEIISRTLGKNHPSYANALYNLALMCIAIGSKMDGMKILKEAASVDDLMIGQVFSIGSERQRMVFLKFITGRFHVYLSLVSQYFYSSQEAINSALDLVLLRKAIGAEALAIQRETI